ncbi:hypothetical protein BPOR_1072g00010 [Botrytis porri]|uniref:Uncharacterized protein n=1 Tax=Botrytis porri TaxID=87229 RepID=A0A4Z1KBT4_9HELO|nr:hypothetical protein BPOR_1072g00010 [Botrytis porri]
MMDIHDDAPAIKSGAPVNSIGAHEENIPAFKVEEVMKGEPTGHSQAENFGPSATLGERDDAVNPVFGLAGIILTLP